MDQVLGLSYVYIALIIVILLLFTFFLMIIIWNTSKHFIGLLSKNALGLLYALVSLPHYSISIALVFSIVGKYNGGVWSWFALFSSLYLICTSAVKTWEYSVFNYNKFFKDASVLLKKEPNEEVVDLLAKTVKDAAGFWALASLYLSTVLLSSALYQIFPTKIPIYFNDYNNNISFSFHNFIDALSLNSLETLNIWFAPKEIIESNPNTIIFSMLLFFFNIFKFWSGFLIGVTFADFSAPYIEQLKNGIIGKNDTVNESNKNIGGKVIVAISIISSVWLLIPFIFDNINKFAPSWKNTKPIIFFETKIEQLNIAHQGYEPYFNCSAPKSINFTTICKDQTLVNLDKTYNEMFYKNNKIDKIERDQFYKKLEGKKLTSKKIKSLYLNEINGIILVEARARFYHIAS